jgi:hypothetical protein
VAAGEKPPGVVSPNAECDFRIPTEMKSVKRGPEESRRMNLILQAFEDSPLIIDASGWVVLLASLVITVGWLWYLYR